MTIPEMTAVLERTERLDGPAGKARDAVQRVLRAGALKDALHGVWLGHPLHPALAQITLGSFTSASLIDAIGGGRRESSSLIAAGLFTTLPTVAAGWADYADGHEEQQRVGIVHAATNIAAVACYSAALVVRARGGRGRVPSIAGGVISGLGAYLGGHMAFRQAMGPNQAAAVAHRGPEQWQPLGPLVDFSDGRPALRQAGDTAVVVVRRGADVFVLSDQCPHLSAPLNDGATGDLDGTPTITCPWHASVFRLTDGGVVHGPATAPVPAFETRVLAGVVEARVRTFPGVPAG